MAAVVFDKDTFLKTAKEVKESKGAGGKFPPVQDGIYILQIEDGAIKENESGSQMAGFGFQVTKENQNHVGQYVWWNCCIRKRGAESFPEGMQQFSQMLYKLSEGEFNGEKFAENPDQGMEDFYFTKVKAQVKITENTEQYGPKYSVKVLQVLVNNYAKVNGIKHDMEDSSQQYEVVTETESPDMARKLIAGYPIVYDNDDGTRSAGRVKSYINGETEFSGGMILIQPCTKDFEPKLKENPIAKSQESCYAIPEQYERDRKANIDLPESPYVPVDGTVAETVTDVIDEEILDEGPKLHTKVFEKGEQITYEFEGKFIEGEVYDVTNQGEGFLKVIAMKDGKKIARKVPLGTIIPFDDNAL